MTLFCFGIAECTPEEAFSIVGDNVVFASGSPFKDVDLGMYEDKFVSFSSSIVSFL